MAAVTRSGLQETASRFVEVWKGRDPLRLALFYAADAVAESPMYATLRGRKAIEDAQRAFFTSFPDATIEVDATIIDPPHIAVFSTLSATHQNDFFGLPGTNRHLDFRMSRLLKMNDDGLIAHERRIYDSPGCCCRSAC